jgi:hypothetical protein
VCTQSYIIGSGTIKQTVFVNRTCRCVLFDQVFNSNDALKQFAPLLRPLLYGKIYYHPSNTQYDNLMNQINQTFESINELVDLLRQIEKVILPLSQRLPKICQLIPDLSFICQQLPTYTQQLPYFILFTELIACSERNRFVAKPTEADMVQDAQNNVLTNTFLAGIEFLDDISNNDPLPKHVRYKIRMALDYVDNTFQTEDQ